MISSNDTETSSGGLPDYWDKKDRNQSTILQGDFAKRVLTCAKKLAPHAKGRAAGRLMVSAPTSRRTGAQGQCLNLRKRSVLLEWLDGRGWTPRGDNATRTEREDISTADAADGSRVEVAIRDNAIVCRAGDLQGVVLIVFYDRV